MMRQYELVERVQAYNPHTDEALLNKAYVYAMQKHGTQKRASGDPYFAHPLEVAAILTDLKLDDASIAVALLHDTIEDTDATRAEIDQLFGAEIGAIVDGLTKIDRLQLVTREEAQAENLRKLLLAISADVRVLLVKLADRLHNMRTLDFMPPRASASASPPETMDIYAPLAGRMGMQDMRQRARGPRRSERLQPEHYKAITDRLERDEGRVRRNHQRRSRRSCSAKLKGDGIDARVTARVKSPWSIFTKIERKQIALGTALRHDRLPGHRADGRRTATGRWGSSIPAGRSCPGRFKDYISVPKHNDYRSIHTTIVGRRAAARRAADPHRGDAPHRRARHRGACALQGGRRRHPTRSRMKPRPSPGCARPSSHLTTRLVAGGLPPSTRGSSCSRTRCSASRPSGRLIALPRGATPIDFAYSLHTDIGDTDGGRQDQRRRSCRW